MAKEKSRKYKGRTYTASPGSITALEDHDFDVSAAVEAGKFDWADEPYAAAQAAHIVAKGEPIQQEAIVRLIIRNLLLEKKKKAKKKKKKKRKVKCPLLPNGKRDYKCEYQKYGGASKKGKKDRAARNKARKQAEKMGLVRKGDGLELDHIMPLSLGGANTQTNWQIMSRTDNRKKGKKWDGKSGTKKQESLRKLIRNLITEAFSEEDVRNQMTTDERDYGSGKFGANAKDIFRQQREADPKINAFLESLVTIHWKRIKIDEFSYALDDDLIVEPLANTNPNDELSCTPYLPAANGYPEDIENRGWHVGRDDMLGIQIKGYVSWCEHGDAQTGHGGQRKGDSQSGDNKQPRRTLMGSDPGKRMKMDDVIQSKEDFENWNTLSTYGDGEALVDNWEVVKIWYKDDWDEMKAWQAAKMMGKRFNKQIPFQRIGSDREQFEHTDFYGESYGEGWEPEDQNWLD